MAFFDEVRIAGRTLLKRPTFTAIAVLALALGSGANTALFSIVNSVLLKRLPYRDPNALIRIYETFLNSSGTGTGTVSGANLRDWRDQNRSFESLGAYSFQSVNLQGRSDPERLSALALTSDLFPALGTTAIMGLTLSSGDDQPNAPDVAAPQRRTVARTVRRRPEHRWKKHNTRWTASHNRRCHAAVLRIPAGQCITA